MNWRAGFAEMGFYAALALILGALMHFALVLAVPLVATRDAYSRLAALGPPDVTRAAPEAGPGERWAPFVDPAVASAFCVYDLTKGPLRVRAPLGRAGFASLSFHSRRGAVFYALTDRAARGGAIEAVVVTVEQLKALIARDDEDNPSEDLRIVSPTTKGFVFARVFSELPSLYAQAQSQADSLSCASEALPK